MMRIVFGLLAGYCMGYSLMSLVGGEFGEAILLLWVSVILLEFRRGL